MTIRQLERGRPSVGGVITKKGDRVGGEKKDGGEERRIKFGKENITLLR